VLSRIEEELRTAMKAGDKRKVSTLRLLLSVLKNERIKEQRELTDAEIEAAIRRAVKQRKEAIEQYERGGRSDLVAAEREELAILEGYLPQTLSDADLEQVLKGIIAEKGFSSSKDVGLLMKEVMARHRAQVDGKRASEMARALLP